MVAPLVRVRRCWEIPEREAAPERVFFGRRTFLAGVAAGAALAASGCDEESVVRRVTPPAPADVLARYPAARSERFVIDRAITPERVAGAYNNFYEITGNKEDVAELGQGLVTRPWTVEVRGLCARPQTFDVDDLVRTMPIEERVYRHRCVEAWSMAVPWTGFPLAALLDRVQPYAGADYVRFVSFLRPEEAPGQRARGYPWPYREGLRMDEARHELAFLATGIYGHPLPVQHGAPIRLVVPWKYGFKSIKSIARIDLVAAPPRTFWNDMVPREYTFTANVDPTVAHPRWSQATERILGTDERRRTLPYNGYGEEVATLYARR
jgi:sulfoxide reductase catalytic subunit YedY